jgi:hypothetical protein
MSKRLHPWALTTADESSREARHDQ